MKKQLFSYIFSFLCLIFCLGYLFAPISVNAEEAQGEDELNATISEQIEHLDLRALEEYIASLGLNDGESVTDRLLAYINGGEIDYDNFFQRIGDIFFADCKRLLPAFASITAITILCGIVGSLRSGFNAKTSGKAIFFVAYLSALVPLIAVLIECFSVVSSCIREIQRQMQIVFPLLITLMTASGQTVTASICQPTVAFLSTTVVSLIGDIIFPLTLTIIAFSMASNLSDSLKFGRFSAFFKGVNKWIIGIGVSVFGLFFTVQGISAVAYDGIARRVAKYAIGTGVPIVGGFLSGGFDLAVAGSLLIKNSLGNLGIFLMISILFEPIVLLVSVNLLLRLSAAVTQPFGDNKISDFLSETADNLNYCTAGLLFAAFMYFICLVVVVCASETLL